MPTNDLETLHIADLHDRAADAGIEGYRRLGREELIDKLSSGEGAGRRSRRRKAPKVDLESDTSELETVSDDESSRERPARRRRGGRGRGGGRERERLGRSRDDDERGDREEAETHAVEGVLEVTRQRHGFLHLTGEHEGEPDVYVSAAQVRRCELKDGDEVGGPAREPRRGERHPALVHVDKVNGEDPVSVPDSARGGRSSAPSGAEVDVPEAKIEKTDEGSAADGEGWFVLNANDARWYSSEGRGAALPFLPEGKKQIGAGMFVLKPGEATGMYHWEADQEGFLVLSGKATLIVEGQERPLRRWDFFHCPVNTSHTIVGAGDAPCVLFAFGAQAHQEGDGWGGYPVDELALKHEAGVETETTSAEEAYARFEDRSPTSAGEDWLPKD